MQAGGNVHVKSDRSPICCRNTGFDRLPDIRCLTGSANHPPVSQTYSETAAGASAFREEGPEFPQLKPVHQTDSDRTLSGKAGRQAKAVTQAATPIPNLKSRSQFFRLGPFSIPT